MRLILGRALLVQEKSTAQYCTCGGSRAEARGLHHGRTCSRELLQEGAPDEPRPDEAEGEGGGRPEESRVGGVERGLGVPASTATAVMLYSEEPCAMDRTFTPACSTKQQDTVLYKVSDV